MKLIEAMEILKRPLPDSAPQRTIALACGFTPLHLRAFLAAELRLHYLEHQIALETGLFGDLAGNLARLDYSSIDSLVAVLEWGDFDPRLSIRSLGGWRPADLHDIVKSIGQMAPRLEDALGHASQRLPAVVCMPTLPFPPAPWTRPVQASSFEMDIRSIVASLGASLAQRAGIRILNDQTLNDLSPSKERFDVKSEVLTGFPYSIQHASALAGLLASVIRDQTPKKGLITDLDDTLWGGILGDDGVDGVSWHLDRHTHMHGLYQQFVDSLAGAGVLIGVATKNDPALVDRAFDRKDLLVSRNDMFPVEAHWSAKSESVQRILSNWNVSADSVVFIDDNPMEIAEVKAAFPDMECIVFPKGDDRALWEMLNHLRGVFGKQFLTEADSLRLHSIRSASSWRSADRSLANASDDFLKAADASIAFDFTAQQGSARALELVDKTNQFNLNGKRFSEGEWARCFNDPSTFLLTAAYEDKFGRLGTIAVLMGRADGRAVYVTSWVMSCRAFSRRIEFQCLKYLFEHFGADEIVFDYQKTARNGPLQKCFTELLGVEPTPGLRLSKDVFVAKAPPLFHHIEGTVHV